MLDIDQDKIMSGLENLQKSIENSTLDECVETLIDLSKSANFLIEKNKYNDGYSTSEWNNYCMTNYNLCYEISKTIKLFNEKMANHLEYKYIVLHRKEYGIVKGIKEISIYQNPTSQINPSNTSKTCNGNDIPSTDRSRSISSINGSKTLSSDPNNYSPGTSSSNTPTNNIPYSYIQQINGHSIKTNMDDSINDSNYNGVERDEINYTPQIDNSSPFEKPGYLKSFLHNVHNGHIPNGMVDLTRNDTIGQNNQLRSDSWNEGQTSNNARSRSRNEGQTSNSTRSGSWNEGQNTHTRIIPNQHHAYNGQVYNVPQYNNGQTQQPLQDYDIQQEIDNENGNEIDTMAINNERRENENEEVVGNTSLIVNSDEESLTEYIGKYICVKEYNTEEDHLQIHDTVTINSFTGSSIIGRNCRTGNEGFFPIYTIDSLDGRNIFFRSKVNMEYASKDDNIFILSDTEEGFVPGYNITKEEQGIFEYTNLEPISLDDRLKNLVQESISEEPESTTVQSTEIQTHVDETTSFFDTNTTGDYFIDETTREICCGKSVHRTSQSTIKPINEIITGIDTTTAYDIDSTNVSIEPVQPPIQSNVTILDSVQTVDENKTNQIIKLLSYTLDNVNFTIDGINGNKLKAIQDLVAKIQEMKTKEVDICIEKKLAAKNKDPEVRKNNIDMNRRLCEELLETEKSYCGQLKIMIDKIMKPMEAAVDTNNEMLNRVQISWVFKNIKEIHEFSRRLCDDLTEAFNKFDESGPIPMAEVFLNKFSEWKIYIKYVENFHRINETIENIGNAAQRERFQRFMEQCQNSRETNRSTLKEFIVIPIQRFLKYRLIFEKLKENSDPMEIESYQILDTVENYVYEIGEVMNIAKKNQDNINKMFSIEKTVYNYPPDLLSYTKRSYVGEWEVFDFKKKMMFLYSDTLVFTVVLKQKKNKRYKYSYENKINIIDYDTTEHGPLIIKFKFTTKTNKKLNETGRGSSLPNISSHNLLSKNLVHSNSTPLTEFSVSFNNKEECADFNKKYNIQRDQLINLLNQN